MMKVCIYCNIKSPDGDITFHKIPSDKERRQKWLNAIKLPEERIDKNSYLCSKHFEGSTFCCQIVNKKVHRFLHLDAVPSIFTENHSTEENKNSSKLLFTEYNENEENDDEEDCYFYKIENGIIKRYLQNNLETTDFSSTSQENLSQSNENLNNESIKSKNLSFIKNSQDAACFKEVNIQVPVKVEVLPNFQLPIQIRNSKNYSGDNICDLKFNEFNNHNGSDFIYENIAIDAEDIPFDQIEFSNVNSVNEVEVTTCESESLKINDLENVDMKMKKDNIDNLCNSTIVNNSKKEIKKKNDNIPTIDHIDKENSEIEENCIKNLLYEYLEKNKSCDMVKRYTELKLTELFKRVLNYIECLEEKLEASDEKNVSVTKKQLNYILDYEIIEAVL
ncbi:uncharacterized protein LOC127290987 isoform X2 [Leptopilina boulardi]|uniref:uncharacterized protein LOC127290987 isoform X2 n=1 Tax=Leptopilina boulardi TaxID=63433 RepID=UPI0021F66A15|nr:uncharacterized protein LOC127290987 isoform X2 [Leptopilina boulardi]